MFPTNSSPYASISSTEQVNKKKPESEKKGNSKKKPTKVVLLSVLVGGWGLIIVTAAVLVGCQKSHRMNKQWTKLAKTLKSRKENNRWMNKYTYATTKKDGLNYT